MNLTVVGAGYVGLVTGTCFSDTGNDVAIVDINAERVEALNAGQVPIHEPSLGEFIRKGVDEGRLRFSTDLAQAAAQADVVFLAVGTPAAPDGRVDMKAIDAAARHIGETITDYTVVATKSTVPVGTYKRLTDIIASATSVPFDYVANPEFLKEGAAVSDFLRPDRVIVGLTSDKALKVMRHLYAPFMRRSDRLLVMDPASAELTKYACNAMLATRVSFINEMALLCERLEADIEMVRRGMGSDQRIGPDFLFPSLGYGGSCFPKDISALISMGRSVNQPVRIVEAVDLANQAQRKAMFNRIKHYYGGRLNDKKLAVWGLAFKARTDDVRESPALDLICRLVGAGAKVSAHDPQAMDNARTVLGDRNVAYCSDMYEALQNAHGLAICTEWQDYRTPDFKRMRSLLFDSVVFDGRNLYDLDWMADIGMTYVSLGRPPVVPANKK